MTYDIYIIQQIFIRHVVTTYPSPLCYYFLLLSSCVFACSRFSSSTYIYICTCYNMLYVCTGAYQMQMHTRSHTISHWYVYRLKVQTMVKSASQRWTRCQLSAAASPPWCTEQLLAFTLVITMGRLIRIQRFCA